MMHGAYSWQPPRPRSSMGRITVLLVLEDTIEYTPNGSHWPLGTALT